MKDLVDAINRLATVAEVLVEVLAGSDEDPEPVTPIDSTCPACDGAKSVDGRQCIACIGRGRVRAA